MRILNTQVVNGSGLLEKATIHIKNKKITELTFGTNFDGPQTGDLDAQGWIDIQINGGFGFDFTSNPASIWEVAAILPAYGITGFLPTIISSPGETYQNAISVLKKGPPVGWRGARPLGFHFEGPFLNPVSLYPNGENPTSIKPAILMQYYFINGAAGLITGLAL